MSASCPSSGPRTGARAQERRRRRRRRRGVLAVVALLALTGAVLVAIRGSHSPEDAAARRATTPTASPTSLASVGLRNLPVPRAPFCDLLDPDAVEAALGGSVTGTHHYSVGERVQLSPTVRDVSHEYDCTYVGPRGVRARAWIFAAPVTRRGATSIVRSVETDRRCVPEPSAPAFGYPTVSRRCRSAEGSRTMTLRGLFGDTWLSCQVTTADGSGVDPAERVRRAEQWCMRVATTLGASS